MTRAHPMRRVASLLAALVAAVSLVVVAAPPSATATTQVTISGSITRPTSGEVSVRTQSWTSEGGWTDEVEQARVTAPGSFSFGVDVGYYRVHYVPLVDGYRDEYYGGPSATPSYAPPTATLFTASRTLTAVDLDPFVTARGNVVLESVGPATAGQVTVTFASAAHPELAPVTTTTDADGHYEVAGVVAIDQTVTYALATGASHAPFVTTARIALGANGTYTLPRKNTISGHIGLASMATPAGEGEVTARLIRRPVAGGMLEQIATAQTDAEGRYSFPGIVSSDSYTYSVRVDGTTRYLGEDDMPQFVVIGADVTRDIVLTRRGVLSGTVRTSQGAPIAGIVAVADRYQALDGIYLDTSDGESGSDGAWTIDPVDEGLHDLYFVDPDGYYAPVDRRGGSVYLPPQLLALARGESSTGIDVRMPVASSLVGTVSGRSAEQLAAGAVEIELVVRSGSAWRPTGVTWQASPDGSYGVDGLTPGSYRFTFRYTGADGTAVVTSPPFEFLEGSQRVYSPVLPAHSFAPSTTAFVRALYADFLGRAPSTNDLVFWSEAIERGVARSSIVQGFATSDEYRLIRIDGAYEGILGRAAESSGRSWWLQQMRAGRLSTDDIERQFYGSKEYATRAAGACSRDTDRQSWGRLVILPGNVPVWVTPDFPPPAFVRCLYADLMGREPDAAGLDFWSERAVSSRQSVVDELWRAPEVARARVSSMYALYLGRTPDAKGLAFWTSYIVVNGDTATRASITESAEYFRLASERFPQG